MTHGLPFRELPSPDQSSTVEATTSTETSDAYKTDPRQNTCVRHLIEVAPSPESFAGPVCKAPFTLTRQNRCRWYRTLLVAKSTKRPGAMGKLPIAFRASQISTWRELAAWQIRFKFFCLLRPICRSSPHPKECRTYQGPSRAARRAARTSRHTLPACTPANDCSQLQDSQFRSAICSADSIACEEQQQLGSEADREGALPSRVRGGSMRCICRHASAAHDSTSASLGSLHAGSQLECCFAETRLARGAARWQCWCPASIQRAGAPGCLKMRS